VEEKHLQDAVASAKRMKISVAQALIMLGYAEPSKLEKAMAAEKMVKTGMISVETALKALRIATMDQMTLDAAIKTLTPTHQKTQRLPTVSNAVTQILQAAEIITNEQIGQSLQKSLDTGMQMGRILVLDRAVSSSQMKAALTAIIMSREKKITSAEAVKAVKIIGTRRVSLEQVLFELGLFKEEPGQIIRIGELFSMAGFISESDMLECLEIHILKGQQLGQIFVEQGLVTNDLIETAIVLQGMVSNNSIKAYQAAEALKQVKAKKISVYQALSELNPPAHIQQPNISVNDLFVESGIVSKEIMGKITQDQAYSPVQLAKRILSAGITSEQMVYFGLRCYSLLREGYLSNTDAVAVLKHCHTNKVVLDEALPALGHVVPGRVQWIWK